MDTRKKILIGIAGVVVLALATILSVTQGQNAGVEVRVEAIGTEDLIEIVTASGNIRARRAVDVSSDISARVEELLVDEGDDVTDGQVLLRLERDRYEAAVARMRAQLEQARAGQSQQEANLTRARRDLDRLLQLRARDSLLVSRQQIDDATTDVTVQEQMLESATSGVSVAQAAVAEAEDDLAKTTIRANMDGKITRLNIDEGETVIVGTMNNPGSLVLTISDLSVIEVVVQVDETDVSDISIGDSAAIRIDAFRDQEFSGRVTEIGNSAITPPSQQAGGQQAAIDFEVVITVDPTEAPLRPDLSASADVIVESREGALAVPIIAMTVRDASELEEDGESNGEQSGEEDEESEDVEGVFVVEDGTVTFRAVEIGIAGQEHFEVLHGLSSGDSVVAGPYQRIRQLRNGDQVQATNRDEATDEEGVG